VLSLKDRRTFALRSRVAVVVVVLGAAFAGADPATAKPPGLGCGETITASKTLQADLTNCPNQGIVIGADNVTLNLNGHSIDGDAVDAECPQAEPCDVGVANPDGHDGIRITGGTIREFGLGVFVGAGAERNRVHNVSLTANTYFGAIFDGTTDSVITHSSFTDTGISGLLLFDATRARISHNAFSDLHGYAIVLRNGVFDSQISHNAINSSDHGIVLDDGGARNRIDHNTVSNSNGSAIDTGGGARENRFEHNRLIDNGDGLVSAGALDTVFRHNIVTGSGAPETEAGGFGIILDGAVRNTVEKNVFTGGRGPAMLVVQWESPTPPTDNALLRNTANSKFDDGIFVDAPAIGTRVERNVAYRSGGDGIDIDAAGTTVQRNLAFGNAELGIEAVAGVIDAGGNRAFGNGDRAQCLNVVCSRSR